MAKSILFVDDERPILRSLNRIFQDSDYDLYFAESGEEALQVLANHPVELIISDMRMPTMDGHQLLQRVKKAYPGTMRLILSGFTEQEKVFRSLLDGSAQMYLMKPWNNQKLTNLVANILQLHSMLKEKCLLEKIGEIESLPTLPDMYTRLCNLIEKESEMKDIATLIESDPVIAGRVLRVANSAFFGIKIGSVQQAIAYLGLEILKDLVLTIGVFTLPDTVGRDVKAEMDLLWKHSNLVNQITSVLYQAVHKRRMPEDQASVGLLHDLGMIAMVKQFGTRYLDELHNEKSKCSTNFQEKEKQQFQVSHTELGGYLLHWWQLPYPLVEAALFHHEPLNPYAINKNLLCLVHIADRYSWKSILPAKVIGEVEEDIWRFAGISFQECEKLLYSSHILK